MSDKPKKPGIYKDREFMLYTDKGLIDEARQSKVRTGDYAKDFAHSNGIIKELWKRGDAYLKKKKQEKETRKEIGRTRI
jgi:hypothetical protein